MSFRSVLRRTEASVSQQLDHIRVYFLGPPARAKTSNVPENGGQPIFVSTGERLINELFQAIDSRQSALATGPRGCGKSYCVRKAAQKALEKQIVGEVRYIQGNSQLPRDYLMEDMLVARDDKSLELLPALMFRTGERKNTPSQAEKELIGRFPLWPAFPTKDLTEHDDPRRFWKANDWTLYFFDELNRFSDGFLDSLLSVLEEKIAVRRGESFYVPAVVIATANPPGYDLTAKKLSPPLQARLARSYLMVQPDLEDLVGIILADRIKNDSKLNDIKIPMEIQYRAAGATLCLWGSVEDSKRTGLAYLTPETRDLLRTAELRSARLRSGMRTLAGLSNFGPDARAIGDWMLSAAMKAKERGSASVEVQDLIEVAPAVLPHKIREIFNEGVEPQKGVALRAAVMGVVVSVFTDDLKDLFQILFAVANKFGLNPMDLDELLGALPENRRNSWRLGLSALSRLGDRSPEDVRRDLVSCEALSAEGQFKSDAEHDWCVKLASVFRTLDTTVELMTAWGLDANEVFTSHTFVENSVADIVIEIQKQFDSDDNRPTILKHGAIRQCIFVLLDNSVAGMESAASLFKESLLLSAKNWAINDGDYIEGLRDGRRWLLELQRLGDSNRNVQLQLKQFDEMFKEEETEVQHPPSQK
jgi:MoxR-like ATPase